MDSLSEPNTFTPSFSVNISPLFLGQEGWGFDNPVDYDSALGIFGDVIPDLLRTESQANESFDGMGTIKAQLAHLEEIDGVESVTSELTSPPKQSANLSEEISQISQEAQLTLTGRPEGMDHSRRGLHHFATMSTHLGKSSEPEVGYESRESMRNGSNGASPEMRQDNEEGRRRLLKRNRSWDDIERKKRRQS